MGATTEIAWTDHTFNIVWGCTKVSEACKHCYAETWAKRTGFDVWGQDAPRRTFGEKHWREPLKWNAQAEREGRRHRVFCSSMADVFEAHPTLDQEREKLWPLIEQTPWLDWQLLTKRPLLIPGMLPKDWWHNPRHNVWLGTTAENQEWAEIRLPALVAVPAAVHFVSAEPLLEALDLRRLLGGVDWVIVGGESGPKARPFNLEWASSIVEQCRAAGVAPFVKQLGAFPRAAGIQVIKLADPKGGDITEFPPGLQVREFPTARTT